MGKLILGILLAAFSLSALAQAEETVISICNNNADRAIYSAYLKQAGAAAGWQSRGWFKIEKSSCTDVNIGNYSGNVYLFSQDEFQETTWGESVVKFCVNKTDAFVIDNADRAVCNESNLKRVASDMLAVTPGKTTWSVNPNISSLRICNRNDLLTTYASIAHDKNGSLTSKGWYKIDPNSCRTLTVGKYTGPVAYYAENNLGQYAWEGETVRYCVNRSNAFEIANATNESACLTTATKMVKARTVNVNVGLTEVELEKKNVDTVLRLCNNTASKTLRTSYATELPAGVWQSKGWTTINPGTCQNVGLGNYVGKTYLYAEYNQGQMFWGSGPFQYCVNRDVDFSIDDAANATVCNSSLSQKFVPAFEFNVRPGSNSFTFTE